MKPPRKLRRKRERIAGRLAEAEAENEELWKRRDSNSWFTWAWGDDGFSEPLCWGDATEVFQGEICMAFEGGFYRGQELPAPLLGWAAGCVAADPGVRADAEDWGLVNSLFRNRRRVPDWKPPQVEIGILIDHQFFARYLGPLPSSSELALIDLILATGPLWLRPLEMWKAPEAPLGEALVHLVNHLLVAYPLPGWLQPDRVASFADLFGGSYLSGDMCVAVWLPFLAAARGWRLGVALQLSSLEHGFPLPAAAGRFASERSPSKLIQPRVW